MLHRRDLLKLSALGGAATFLSMKLPTLTRSLIAQAGQLAPFSVPLPIPLVLQPLRSDAVDYV